MTNIYKSVLFKHGNKFFVGVPGEDRHIEKFVGVSYTPKLADLQENSLYLTLVDQIGESITLTVLVEITPSDNNLDIAKMKGTEIINLANAAIQDYNENLVLH